LLPKPWLTISQVMVAICVLTSFATTFTLRYSVWAHETLIGDKPLDSLGIGSLIIAALAVASAECTAFLVLGGAKNAVANVGENQIQDVQKYAHLEPQDAFYAEKKGDG
jgi:hypothetical protein